MMSCSRRPHAERENSEFASTDSLSRMIPKSGERLSEKVRANAKRMRFYAR
jgi:hypothetical protein